MTAAQRVAVVIDDERDVRAVTGLALRSAGWEVREAGDGRAALELVKGGLPGLIVVDLMMSGMSGLEFCNKLLALPGGANVPVLLISGINEKAKLLQDFWQLGLKRKQFLRKPFDVQAMLKLVQELAPAGSPGASAGTGPATSAPPEPPSWMKSAPAAPQQPVAPAKPAPAPAAPKPPAAATGSVKSSSDGEHMTGYRVLIIDDEPDIRMIVETVMGMYHTIVTADNGMEALKTLDEFYPDFVLSDINMPVMNGLDTAEAIRRHPVMSKVPIFFISAETGADIPKRAYDVGGNLFLRKPIDPFKLLNYIDYFLKETGLEPEGNWKRRNQRATETGPPRPAPKPGAEPPLRVLMVDFNIENQNLVRRLIGEDGKPAEVAGGPFEALWTEDPRTAIGNLARWQPDVILYNPRNPGFDGVAFGQTLRLQKVMDQCIVLVGSRFYEADTDYAERVLKMPPVDLGAGDVTRKLGDVMSAVRKRIKPKKSAMVAILAEEAERQRDLQKASAKTSRERDVYRQRYSKIQEFIDRHYD